MTAPRIWTHTIFQGEDLEPLDRIAGRDGARLSEADVADIDVYAYELNTNTLLYSATGLDPGAGVDPDTRVFDTLQTDGRWKVDNVGYNFRHLIPYASVSAGFEGGKGVRVEVVFHTTAWVRLFTVHEYKVQSLRSQA